MTDLSRLSNLSNTISNALEVLGNPSTKRWQIYDLVNGHRTAAMIANILQMQRTNVTNDLTHLHDMGLIFSLNKKGNASVYSKIPELRRVNLKKYSNKGKRIFKVAQSEVRTQSEIIRRIGIKSRAIDQVIGIGKNWKIENINQNWVDVLVILNFIETACTKFLMDHGWSEEQATSIKWDQKINSVIAKLYEEAKAKRTSPRTGALTVLKNYREQRNTIDHNAHVPTAIIHIDEVRSLMATLKLFEKEVFIYHRQYCSLT